MDRSDKHGLDGARSREKTTGLEWPPWSFVRSVALLQMLFEELRSAVPGVVGIGLVVGGLVLVVEKGVVPSRIDLDLHLLARLLDGRLYPPGDLRAHEAVLLGEEAEHGTGELGVVGLDVWMDAVEVHHGANRRIGAAGEEGELAAHAEADRSELGRGGMAGEVGGRAAQILFRLPDVQRHEELARSVGLAGRLAVVHVGRKRICAARPPTSPAIPPRPSSERSASAWAASSPSSPAAPIRRLAPWWTSTASIQTSSPTTPSSPVPCSASSPSRTAS